MIIVNKIIQYSRNYNFHDYKIQKISMKNDMRIYYMIE